MLGSLYVGRQQRERLLGTVQLTRQVSLTLLMCLYGCRESTCLPLPRRAVLECLQEQRLVHLPCAAVSAVPQQRLRRLRLQLTEETP